MFLPDSVSKSDSLKSFDSPMNNNCKGFKATNSDETANHQKNSKSFEDFHHNSKIYTSFNESYNSGNNSNCCLTDNDIISFSGSFSYLRVNNKDKNITVEDLNELKTPMASSNSKFSVINTSTNTAPLHSPLFNNNDQNLSISVKQEIFSDFNSASPINHENLSNTSVLQSSPILDIPPSVLNKDKKRFPIIDLDDSIVVTVPGSDKEKQFILSTEEPSAGNILETNSKKKKSKKSKKNSSKVYQDNSKNITKASDSIANKSNISTNFIEKKSSNYSENCQSSINFNLKHPKHDKKYRKFAREMRVSDSSGDYMSSSSLMPGCIGHNDLINVRGILDKVENADINNRFNHTDSNSLDHFSITSVPEELNESLKKEGVINPNPKIVEAMCAKRNSVSNFSNKMDNEYYKLHHETIEITHGNKKYSTPVMFQEPHARYRHGKHVYITQSLGYSQDGDLVFIREDRGVLKKLNSNDCMSSSSNTTPVFGVSKNYSDCISFDELTLPPAAEQASEDVISNNCTFNTHSPNSTSSPSNTNYSNNYYVINKTHKEIHSAIVLNPSAIMPMSNIEEYRIRKKRHLNLSRNRKYPGIRIRKNKKVRNRIMNDYLAASSNFRELFNKSTSALMADNSSKTCINENSENFLESDSTSSLFQKTEPQLQFNVNNISTSSVISELCTESKFNSLCSINIDDVDKSGSLSNTGNVSKISNKDPESGEIRFNLLNTKLRKDVRHAINSEYLSNLMFVIEKKIIQYIQLQNNYNKKLKTPFKPLSFALRDGYARLICHAVATYYKLISFSENVSSNKDSSNLQTFNDGSDIFSRITFVKLPDTKKAKAAALKLPYCSLLQYLGFKNYINLDGINEFDTVYEKKASISDSDLVNFQYSFNFSRDDNVILN